MIIFFCNKKNSRFDYFNKACENFNNHSHVVRYEELFKQKKATKIPDKLTVINAIYNEFIDKKLRQKHSRLSFFFYKARAHRKILRVVTYATTYLKQKKPAKVIVWNGLGIESASIAYAANSLHIPIFFMENGALPNTTTIDSTGINFKNSLPRNASFYKKLSLPSPPRQQLLNRDRATKNKTIKTEELSLKKPYIFIPFQVDGDSQILLYSAWVKNMEQLFKIGLHIARSAPDITFYFRQHPSSKINYSILASKQTKNALFADMNSMHALIDNAEAIITINSSVGIEALCYGKPVITLGECFYNIPGITTHANNEEELLHIIKTKAYLKTDKELQENFLNYLQHIYYCPDHWQQPSPLHFEFLRKKLEIVA